VRPTPKDRPGLLAAGLLLALGAAVLPACAQWRAMHAPAGESTVAYRSEMGPAASGAPGPVTRALALANAGQGFDAVRVLEEAVEAQDPPSVEALYWLGVLRLAPPVSDRAGGRDALERVTRREPDGALGHVAAGLLTLLDEVDRLGTDNAALREDLKKLLDIDVEAQRKRQAPGTTAP
jgi:hypothetical protein